MKRAISYHGAPPWMQSRFLVSVAPGETRMKNIADCNHLFSRCRVDRKDQMGTSNKGLKHTLETIRCLIFAIGNSVGNV